MQLWRLTDHRVIVISLRTLSTPRTSRASFVTSAFSASEAASPRTVELLDLYPTLADVCGVEAPKNLVGKSLRPLLDAPDVEWDRPAITQVTRGQNRMGYSLRTERYRFTEWADGSRELYDYQTDPTEQKNLAKDSAQTELVSNLAGQLKASIAQQAVK